MAKKKKERNYEQLTVEELTREVEKNREDLFKVRFRLVSATLKNTMQVRTLRREIARLETFIQQRRQSA